MTIIALVLLMACGGGVGGDEGTPWPNDDRGFRNFREVVSTAAEDGYTPYWLGREFMAGGLLFQGPEVADFGDEVEGGGVEFSYNAVTPDGRGLVAVSLFAYSQEAWSIAEPVIGTPARGTIESKAEVNGQEGTMWAIPAGERIVNQRRLFLRFGDTMVQVIAGAGSNRVPDINPLIDEATFLAVMEELRPYPE